MWKDTDFKEIFANYSVSPPQKVWTGIAYAIEKNGRPKAMLPFFSQSQKMALVAACLSSVLFCGFMLRLVEEDSNKSIDFQNNTIATDFHAPLNTSSSVSTKKESRPPVLSVPKIASASRMVSKKSSIRIPEEYKPFEKDILALVELDKQIAKLQEEIQVLKAEEPSLLAWETPILAQVQSKIEAKTIQNYKKYQDHLISETVSLQNETKLPDLASVKPKFIERFYLTPYMGANISHVFYQDKPANNFFSDKAQFNGQIGYNAGVQFGYQLSKKWSLESGFGLGQYVLGFKEDYGTYFRDGSMYIDQLDIPLLARYSINLNKKNLPLTLALKGGFIYNNVIFYQVNYTDKFNRVITIGGQNEQSYSFDVDKRQYNSMQFGYAAGFDFDAYFSKKIALNVSMLNTLVSQVNNFPFFSAEKQRPVQFSTSFSIGTKIKF
jgi:hypothetical protein